MELNSIDISLAESGVEMTVLDADYNKTDATITLLGVLSNKARAVMMEAMRAKKEDDGENLLAELTIGWKNITLDGKEIPFSKEKAKELYKEILDDYENGLYSKSSAMFLDEILMRQGSISPAVIAEKYKDSEEMQQKALMQELMIDKRDKKYENILKTQAIYKKISRTISA